MTRWYPLLLCCELFLVLLAGIFSGAKTFLFTRTLFIYFMTGGLLFYALIFEKMTKKKMFRRQVRRWLVISIICFKFPLWILLACFFLFAFRGSLVFVLWFLREKGWNQKRLAIIGSHEVVEALEGIFWTGYKVVAFDPEIDKLSELKVDELWLAFPLKEQARAIPILEKLKHSTINITLIPNLGEITPLNLHASNIGHLPAICVQESPMHGLNRLFKNIEDKVLAFCILVVASPLMLLAALLVKLSSPGPIFYRQERVSWNNEVFSMLKFRTMPVAAEATTGPVWASAADNRTTFIGKFLRRSCIDELPQFFNVLKGEMSIVGPRPERPYFIEQFKDQIPSYMQKHMVKAGITGLAQIRGFRGQSDLTRRIEYDLQYIREWSVWLDLKIIVLTLIKGFKNAY